MSTTPNPAAAIAEDVPCTQCGYNLRTRFPTDLCPECAHTVGDSLQEFVKRSKIFPNAFLATCGLNLLALAFASQFLFSLFRVPHLFRFILPWAGNYIFTILTIVLTNVGVATLLYAQRFSRASTHKMYWAGQWINGVNALALIAIIVRGTISHFGPHTAAFRSTMLYVFPTWFQIANDEVADASLALLLFLFIFYVSRLTRAIPAPRLRLFGLITFSSLALFQCVYMGLTNVLFYTELVRHTATPEFLISGAELMSFFNPLNYMAATLFVLLLGRRVVDCQSPPIPSASLVDPSHTESIQSPPLQIH